MVALDVSRWLGTCHYLFEFTSPGRKSNTGFAGLGGNPLSRFALGEEELGNIG